MTLLFNHPAGWLMMNLLIPMKAMSEYADIHKCMLQYVLKRDSGKLDAK
jgi:hypothetical protein